MIFVLIAIAIIAFLLSLGVNTYTFTLLRRLTKQTDSKSLVSMLSALDRTIKKNVETLDLTSRRFNHIENDNLGNISKVGLVRFSAYNDTGGDQSIALAMLNRKNDGIILTSLQHRKGAKIYAKEVKEGKAEVHKLMTEEKKALKKALEK